MVGLGSGISREAGGGGGEAFGVVELGLWTTTDTKAARSLAANVI